MGYVVAQWLVDKWTTDQAVGVQMLARVIVLYSWVRHSHSASESLPRSINGYRRQPPPPPYLQSKILACLATKF